VDYLIITDEEGRIVADSEPDMVGMLTGRISILPPFRGRVPLSGESLPAPRAPIPLRSIAGLPPGRTLWGFNGQTRGASYVIFVGLNMAPVRAAHDQDTRNTIITAAVLLLISIAGIVSLLLALGYRSARASLSRVKALSDSLVEHMPVGIVAVDPDDRIMVFNDTAETLFGRTSEAVIGKPTSDILPPRAWKC